MRFLAHGPLKTMQRHHVSYRPRPVYDFIESMSDEQLSNYAPAAFKNYISNLSPHQLCQYAEGYPYKPIEKWTSTDVGENAYLRRNVIVMQSKYDDVFEGFKKYYKSLSEPDRLRLKEMDRQCCLIEHGYNANWKDASWWDATVAVCSILSSYWHNS